MAGAAKRARCGAAAAAPDAASVSARALPAFLRWCAEAGVELSAKVCVSCEGTVADYGLMARENLGAGEVLFTIPRTVLLSQHTSSLSSLLEKGTGATIEQTLSSFKNLMLKGNLEFSVFHVFPPIWFNPKQAMWWLRCWNRSEESQGWTLRHDERF